MSKILLGVTGSIAAYKAADITSRLTASGHDVHVVMTKAATGFITPLTMQSLSKNRVFTHVLQEEEPDKIAHIDLAQSADLLLIAPATGNCLAKLAHGIADDMLTSIALAIHPETPRLIAPAMNTVMYQNPATRENESTLLARGWQLVEPRESRLACGTVGKGALATAEAIVAAAGAALGTGQ